MDIDKSYIILMHKYAAERINTGFSPSGMRTYLTDNGIDLSGKDVQNGVTRILREIVHNQPNMDVPEDGTYFMLSDSYYRYVEYLELVEARNNSKETKKFSIIAISIASGLALMQIILGLPDFLNSLAGC